MEKIDFVDADDALFVPREVVEAFNGIYDKMKEAQRLLQNVSMAIDYSPIKTKQDEDNQ